MPQAAEAFGRWAHASSESGWQWESVRDDARGEEYSHCLKNVCSGYNSPPSPLFLQQQRLGPQSKQDDEAGPQMDTRTVECHEQGRREGSNGEGEGGRPAEGRQGSIGLQQGQGQGQGVPWQASSGCSREHASCSRETDGEGTLRTGGMEEGGRWVDLGRGSEHRGQWAAVQDRTLHHASPSP